MYKLHFISILFFLCNCNQPMEKVATEKAANTNKGQLFIIGGGKRPESMIRKLVGISGIDKNGYGIILPMSSAEPDSAVYYAKIQFSTLGLENVVGMNFNKGETITKAQQDSISHASMIYIAGGDQNKFMDIVGNTPIESAIKEAYRQGSVIAGTSAGAAVMSEKMITGNELRHPEYEATFRNIESDNIELKQGLGLLETAIVDQHFVKRSRHNRLFSAVIEHPNLLGIGIDESTAIIVKGDSAEVVGDSQVIVFSNPEQSKKQAGALLGAESIQVDILLPGSRFSLIR